MAWIVTMGENSLLAAIYGNNMVLLTLIISMGIGFGCQIIVSHLMGSGSFQKIKASVNSALKVAVAGSFALAVLVYFSSDILFSFFTADSEVIALGKTWLLLSLVYEPVRAVNIVHTFSLRAAGDSVHQALWGSVMTWTLGLFAVWGISSGLEYGLIGIKLGMVLDEAFRSLVYMRRWNSGAWMKTGVIQRQESSRQESLNAVLADSAVLEDLSQEKSSSQKLALEKNC
jgi:Na+-driven multidrug efflux pump